MLAVIWGRSVVSSTNKIDLHDITEILLKLALNTITSALEYFEISIVEQI
jgi:hypothetical protein